MQMEIWRMIKGNSNAAYRDIPHISGQKCLRNVSVINSPSACLVPVLSALNYLNPQVYQAEWRCVEDGG